MKITDGPQNGQLTELTTAAVGPRDIEQGDLWGAQSLVVRLGRPSVLVVQSA